MTQLQKQPFSQHLAELRTRGMWVCIVFLVGSAVGYTFYAPVLDFLLKPLKQQVYYTTPGGGFNFSIQVSLLIGFLVSLPVLLYHVFRFLAPIFPKQLERQIYIITIAAFFLMLTGVSFAYFGALPATLHFFSGFNAGEIHSLISATDYLSFVTKYMIGFGILFQLPLILLIINNTVGLHAKKLLSYQRHAIVASFIIGALLSPAPDPFNMFLMSLPLIGLYYISIFLIMISNKRKHSTRANQTTNQPTTQEAHALRPRTRIRSKKHRLDWDIYLFFVTVFVAFFFAMAGMFTFAAYQNIHQRARMEQKTVITPASPTTSPSPSAQIQKRDTETKK